MHGQVSQDLFYWIKGHLTGIHGPLLQSGLDEKWWADSMECYTYLRNLQVWWETPYERRFGEPLKGPIIPLGWLVEYYPISAKDQSRIHQFGQKVFPGLFLGYALYAWENLEGWHNGCRRWGAGNDRRIGNLRKNTQCERGDIPQRKWRIHFPSRRWTNQTSWRRSRPENIHLDTGSSVSRRKSQRFSMRIRRVSTFTTSRLISGCRWSDKWFLVHVRKLQKPPSRWTKSQTLLAERSIIPYSTEVHWRFQNYTYEFGCQARETHRRLLENRWVTRLVRSSRHGVDTL